ncbi:MAG: LolA-related protein [Pseudomonadota bacterium]
MSYPESLKNPHLKLLTAVLLLIVSLSGLTAFASAGGWTVNNLMDQLAAVKRAELEFTETRSSIFLTEEVSTRGMMNYRAPDFIEKLVTDPYSERILIDGDQIVVEQQNAKGNNKKRVFLLSNYEALNATIQGIRATLAGDISQLQKSYRIKLEGDELAWELILEPITESTRGLISMINLSGVSEQIRSIEMTEPNGDESKLTLVYKSIN